MRKIYCTEGANYYASWIDDHEIVNSPENADIILFTGGEDVNPELYGEAVHPRTYFNAARDAREKAIFDNMKENQVAVCVCRGSQFACVMNGGKLIQHVTNHAIASTHEIYPICEKYVDIEKRYDITSTHHQMQYPYTIDKKYYDVLYSANFLSRVYEGGGIERYEMRGEPEIVFYHVPNKPKCLAIQGHPEMMRKDAPVIGMLNELINNLLFDKK